MGRFKIILAVAILISSIVILFSKLFSPMPIQITLETGQEITTQNPQYFALSEVLLLVVSSFLIGGTVTYLYYKSDIKGKVSNMISNGNGGDPAILKLLKTDERKVFLALHHARGEMLQNALVKKSGLSKVKVTRILSRLERKGLVLRERHGLTNKIKLKGGES
jgi:uncharacterized membrane protein